MKALSRRSLWATLIAAVLLSLYFVMWFIQTDWLASFPARDIEYYSRWAFIQLAVAVGFAALVLAAAVGLYRSSDR